MHGLGNDFVILDGRLNKLALTPAQIRLIADRKRGVGCDQLIVLEPVRTVGADVFMRILNSDGSEAEGCGNATRCVADILMNEMSRQNVTVETVAGLLKAERQGALISVNMGSIRTDWKDIPLAQEVDTANIPLSVDVLKNPVGINVGNPHAVFFVANIDMVPLDRLGPKVEHHAMFPAKVNASIAQVIDRSHIRHRVWERGVGITQACGTAACATAAAGVIRGLTDRKVTITLDGGDLSFEWLDDGHMIMTGPATYVFRGVFDTDILS